MSRAHSPSEMSVRFFFICLMLHSSRKLAKPETITLLHAQLLRMQMLRAQGSACRSPPCPPK